MPRRSDHLGVSWCSRLKLVAGVLVVGCALLLPSGQAAAQDNIGQSKTTTRTSKPKASAKPKTTKATPKAPAQPAKDPFFKRPDVGGEAQRRRAANPFPDESATAPASDAEATDAAPASALEAFRSELEPHGRFFAHPEHGTVWIPDAKRVGRDFAPYRSDGHWAVDDRGQWNWVSDHPWGDLAFHFGRWAWLADDAAATPAGPAKPEASLPTGWAWVPGTEFAPAWVVWRTPKPGASSRGQSFVGWAPMPPTHRWVNGEEQLHPGTRALPFWFVGSDHLFDPQVARFVVADARDAKRLHGITAILPAHDALRGELADKLSATAAVKDGGPSAELKRGLTEVDPSRALRPASPSFRDAEVLPSARPSVRIAPLDGVSLLPTFAKDGAASAPSTLEAAPLAPRADPARPARRHDRSGRRRGPRRGFEGHAFEGRGFEGRAVQRRFVRRCVHTSRGKRCWTYRYPPRWRGR